MDGIVTIIKASLFTKKTILLLFAYFRENNWLYFRVKTLHLLFFLKKSRSAIVKNRKLPMSVLPWYLIIGPPNAGKSTLLKSAGFNLPLHPKDELQHADLDGLINCQWWLSDKARLLSTAGQYMDQSNDEEWLTLLKTLKIYRHTNSLKGVILTINLEEILTNNSEAIDHLAKFLRCRIDEMYQYFRLSIPIYLIFNKIDYLEGFAEFFSDFSENDCKQIWGLTFNSIASTSEKINSFQNFINSSYVKLTHIRRKRFIFSKNLQQTLNLYEFPEQFKRSELRLTDFVKQIMESNQYQENCYLVGVYLISSKQTSGRKQVNNYFLDNLFYELILKNFFPQKEKQKNLVVRNLKKLWITLALCFALSVCAALYFDFMQVNKEANRGKSMLERLLIADNNFHQNQLMLHAVFLLYQKLSFEDHNDHFWGLNYYLQRVALPIYKKILNQKLSEELLYPIAKQLEHELRFSGPLEKRADGLTDSYYNNLHLYFMLCFPNKIQISIASELFLRFANQAILMTNIDKSNSQYIQYLFTQLKANNVKAWPVDKSLLSAARAKLYNTNYTKNLYAHLVSQGIFNLGFTDFSKLTGNKFINYYYDSTAIPVMYTAKGWKQFVKPAIDRIILQSRDNDLMMNASISNLVVNHDKDQLIINYPREDKLKRDLEQYYFADYRAVWLNVISNLQLRQFNSLRDASKALKWLSSPIGPLIQILAFYKDNFEVDPENMSNMKTLLNNGNLPTIWTLLYLKHLNAVAAEMASLAESLDRSNSAIHYAADILANINITSSQSSKALTQLNSVLSNIPNSKLAKEYRKYLMLPILSTWGSVLREASQDIQNQWDTRVFTFYRQTILGRFPLSDQGTDMGYEDAIHFFGNNGILSQFVNQTLSLFLINENGWIAKKWLNKGINFKDEFLNRLNETQSIRTVIDPEIVQPTEVWQIYPIPTPGLAQIILEVNGVNYYYQNGPQEWENLTPSFESQNPSAAVKIITSVDSIQNEFVFNGNWALWHLLKQAKLNMQSNGMVQATWEIKCQDFPYKVSYQFNNQFSKIIKIILINSWQLPEKIVSDNR